MIAKKSHRRKHLPVRYAADIVPVKELEWGASRHKLVMLFHNTYLRQELTASYYLPGYYEVGVQIQTRYGQI